jgi:hypothetical protein
MGIPAADGDAGLEAHQVLDPAQDRAEADAEVAAHRLITEARDQLRRRRAAERTAP